MKICQLLLLFTVFYTAVLITRILVDARKGEYNKIDDDPYFIGPFNFFFSLISTPVLGVQWGLWLQHHKVPVCAMVHFSFAIVAIMCMVFLMFASLSSVHEGWMALIGMVYLIVSCGQWSICRSAQRLFKKF